MDICRVCLSLSPEKDINALKPTKSQEPKSSTEIFEFCLNIPVTEDSKITTKLCTKCFQKVLSYYKFKILALKSNEYLRSNASNTINDLVKLKDYINASNTGFNDNDTGDDFNNLIFDIHNKDELDIKAECMESDGSDDAVFNLFEAKTEIEDSVLYRPGGCHKIQSAADTIDTMQNVYVMLTENVGEKGAPSPKTPNLDDNQPVEASEDIKLERYFSTPIIINTEVKPEHLDNNERTGNKVELDNRKGKKHITETIKFDINYKMAFNTGEKLYSCSICDKTFSHKGNLNRHVRVHTGEKPHSCSICDKAFTDKGSLNKHVRSHAGKKPHSCSMCDKTFTHKRDLNRHVRVHTGEKSHSCSICDKEFSDKGNLIIHVRTHTGEKPYSCSICDKAFSDKSGLNRHVTAHTGEKPLSCSMCDKKFTNKWNLNRHVRAHGFFRFRVSN